MTNLENKIMLVTGATAGIGEATALELARQGATVVGVGRNPQKCAAVSERIQRETGNARVEFLVADLSLVAEVRRVAQVFQAKYARLDVLVNNAGAFNYERIVTAEGRELTWALNHLNYFVLTTALLPLLKASAPSRVVSVSSGAHFGGHLNFDDLEGARSYSGWSAYAQSKLANVMFTYELARRLEGTGVTANVLHPGFVATNFGHNNRGLVDKVMSLIQRLAALTPQQGAATQLYLAAAPEVDGVSGKYFDNRKAVASSRASYDVAAQQRLWALSEAAV